MTEVIFFSKAFKGANVKDLIRKAHEIGAEGYDLAVRPGYVVTPENVESLPAVVEEFRSEGLSVPMVTGPVDFVRPGDPRAVPFLRAMREAGVELVKLGYFPFDPAKDYWNQVDGVRREMEGWAKLGREYGVTICYHTHSGGCMGQNASSLAHLIHGFDPRHIGAYLDPGHLVLCGEEFDFAVAVVRDHLRVIGLKDSVYKTRKFVQAGQGDANWEKVFAVLAQIGFSGPLSVHAEYVMPTPGEYEASLGSEVAFFRTKRDATLKAVS